MQKIKMPDWKLMTTPYSDIIEISILNDWFNEYLVGKYLVDESDLVEVFGRNNKILSMNTYGDKTIEGDTHKAYLIKSSIEPLGKRKVFEEYRDAVFEYTRLQLSQYAEPDPFDGVGIGESSRMKELKTKIDELEKALEAEHE